ncbi:MAG: metal ABC transporter permease [Helicobacteraceae bacterium]|jgi:zinc transport system permease protein|nr:metal ABC transporter permease [Helicobacteraceae bacterium]
MLEFVFIQNAIAASVLLSIAIGIIGSLIVVNRMVFLSGGVAHASYGGIGLAIFFGFSPFLGAAVFAVIAALFMTWIVTVEKRRSDMMIGIIWAVGMAIGVILIDISGSPSGDLMAYLFGSLAAIDRDDLALFLALDIGVIVWVFLSYKKLLAVSFDDRFARSKGINVQAHNLTMLFFASIMIVAAIMLVGLMLVMALLTIPVWLGSRVAKSLWQTMIFSALFSLLFLLLGLFISYYYNITSGAAVIITASVFFLIGEVTKKRGN